MRKDILLIKIEKKNIFIKLGQSIWDHKKRKTTSSLNYLLGYSKELLLVKFNA